ncbi:MAG: DNA cytosine methyltransferase [Candidatus Caldarchaeum sp.]
MLGLPEVQYLGERGEGTSMGRRQVLDLFCGIGGLALGFARAGFEVVGMDIDHQACATYELNGVGKTVQADLVKERVGGEFDLIIGGPPCEPWSFLNLTKRGRGHPAYPCLRAFYDSVRRVRPVAFVMENVPGIREEPVLLDCLTAMLRMGYLVSHRIIRYSDHGSSTARRRLFVIGIMKGSGVTPEQVFDGIARRPAGTVREAIGDLRGRGPDPLIDHVWPKVRTVERYLHYYVSGRYGWYILRWDQPAPSFGNVTKTYILHPDSFNGGETRPISVREALRIMGFSDDFRFPQGTSLRKKYEMIADSVSPVFSAALVKSLKRSLGL